jgi:hypothetical protein
MLRGAIDLIHPDRIGGWIYSETGSVGGLTMLAFVDGTCVGSGAVEVFRKDLAEAGLGDGHLGFSFPISLPNSEDLNRVIVRLDGSDLVLLQSTSKIVATKTADSFKPLIHSSDSIEWMRSSGWLAPAEFTFLKYVQQIGAYDYSLRQPKSTNQQSTDLVDPLVAAQPMFDLLFLRRALIVDIGVPASESANLIDLVLAATKRPLPIVAVTCFDVGSISVLEGSQSDGQAPESLLGAVDYPYGPDRLLFLNLNCVFSVRPGPSSASLRILAAA